MKNRLILSSNIIVFILMLPLFYISTLNSQAQSVATYDCSNLMGDETQLPVKICSGGIKASPIIRGSGINPHIKEGMFNSNCWTTSSNINQNDYLEFTITPDCGYTFKLTEVTMYHDRSLKGPEWFSVRTSYDSFASDQGGVIKKEDVVDVIKSVFMISIPETDKPLTIRIYAYHAKLETGLWGIGGKGGDDLVVKGAIKSKPFLINEADIDTYGNDNEEFIEIYDGGCGSKSLNGHILVLFDGETNKSYRTIDLSGNATDSRGYFVVGHEKTNYANMPCLTTADNIKNGSHAIAIYKCHPQYFPDGQVVDTISLVDALVYSNSSSEPSELSVLLKNGEVIKDENVSGKADEYSLQRMSDGSGGARRTGTFYTALPTPGMKNFDAVWSGSSNKQWENGLNWMPNRLSPGLNAKIYIPGGLASYPSAETIQQIDQIVMEDGARINNQEKILANEVSVNHKITYSNSNQAPDRWQYFTPVIKNVRAADLLSQNNRNDVWIAKYDNTLSEEMNNCWDFNLLPESELENISGYAVASVYDESEEGEEKTRSWQTITMSGQPVDATNPLPVTLKEGWNLTGNPYLTSIDWFDSQSIDYSLIQGKAAYKYNPSTDSYITMVSDGNGSGLVIPGGSDQYISSGQGYFVNAASDGTFSLNPECRTDASTPFLKSGKVENYIKFTISDGNSKDETLITANEEASDDFDSMDAEKLLSSKAENIQIFTTVGENKRLVLNALKTIESEISLSILAFSREDLTLSIEGNLKNYKIESILLKNLSNKEERSIRIDESIDFKMPDNKSELMLLVSLKELKSNSVINKHDEYDPEINYCNGNLEIKDNKEYPSEIIITDYSGREIHAFKLKEKDMSFPVNLEKGIYVITLINSKKVTSVKISITK